MQCAAVIALLVAAATASPIKSNIFYSDFPNHYVTSHGDQMMDYLRSSVYEKPIFVASRAAADEDDRFTATLIDGGYHSLAVKPQFRLFRDQMLSGDKMVYLMHPNREVESVLPLKHLIVPNHYHSMRSADLEDSAHSHPWIVFLDQSDMHSNLFSNLRKHHAIDVTDDSARLLKSALVGYEPIAHHAPHFALAAHPGSGILRAGEPLIVPDYHHSRFLPLHMSQYPYTMPERFTSSPYVTPERYLSNPFLMRSMGMPYYLQNGLRSDLVDTHPATTSAYRQLLLDAALRSAHKPTYFLLYNAKDFSDVREISEEDALKLLKHGKASAFDASSNFGFGSKSLLRSEAEESLSGKKAESMSGSSSSSGSSSNSGGRTVTKTVETIVTTTGEDSNVKTGTDTMSSLSGSKTVEASSKTGLLGSLVKTGSGLISTGAKAVHSGAEEIVKASEGASIKTMSDVGAGVGTGLLGGLLHAGAGLVGTGAAAVSSAADVVSDTAEKSFL